MAITSVDVARQRVIDYYYDISHGEGLADLTALLTDEQLLRHARFLELEEALAEFPEAYDACVDFLSDMRFS